jgi:hypothetical protein
MPVLRTLVLAAFLVAVPARARAQAPAPPDAAAVEEAKKHFAAGQRLFDAGDLRGAVEEMKEAYRLTRNPLLLYNVGVVYDKLGDAALALHYFAKFIDEARDDDRTHARLVEAGRRAEELRRAAPGEEPASPPAAPPSAPEEKPPALVHEPIDQAPPGRPIDVTAQVPQAAAVTVTLAYRAAGEDVYRQVKMLPRRGLPGELVARIPAAAATGATLQYYLAARDGEGKVVASSGKASAPNLIVLDAAAPIHAFVVPGDDPGAAPLAAPAPAELADRSPPRPATFYAKWAASGGALALLGVGVGFGLAARSYADTLRDEAIKSSSDECAPDPPPCRFFSAPRKDLESAGQRYQRWGNVALVAGAAAAVAAGVLWYLDARAEPVAVPLVAPGTVGAAAAVRF